MFRSNVGRPNLKLKIAIPETTLPDSSELDSLNSFGASAILENSGPETLVSTESNPPRYFFWPTSPWSPSPVTSPSGTPPGSPVTPIEERRIFALSPVTPPGGWKPLPLMWATPTEQPAAGFSSPAAASVVSVTPTDSPLLVGSPVTPPSSRNWVYRHPAASPARAKRGPCSKSCRSHCF